MSWTPRDAARALLLLAGLAPGAACLEPPAEADGADDDSAAGVDADGDGFPASVDCDDAAPDVHPGADEACNDRDDDCDDAVDEDARASIGDQAFATVGDALAASAPGDTVRLCAGVYTDNLEWPTWDVVLRGAGADQTVLDASQCVLGAALCSGIRIDEPHGGDSQVLDLSVTGGLGTSDGTLTRGGGILLRDAAPRLERVRVSDCQADHGGGVFLDQAPAVLVSLTIEGNAADVGGGLYAVGTELTLEDSDIGKNLAGDGAGVFVDASGGATLERCRFHGNEAARSAGALRATGGALELRHVRFEDSHAEETGGAVLADTATVDVHNCLFLASSAKGGGGDGASALDVRDAGEVVVRNNTFAVQWGPTAVALGVGGIFQNNIVAHSDENGVASPVSLAGVAYTLWWDNGNDFQGIGGVDATNTTGDPDFLALDLEADPSTWDLHLGPASAARDAGNPADEFDDPDTSRNDIGAYGGPYGVW